MSDSGLGFGGFLLGLGIGWYLFQYIDLGFEAFSYLLILMGVGMILSGLLTRGRKQHPISGIYGGLIGGLFLAAFLTQGFNFVFNISDQFTDIVDGSYRVTQGFTFNTDLTSDTMDLDIDSVNGGINVYSWSGDNIRWEVEVKAKGDTNAEAEERIDEFEYDLTNELVSGVQEISMSFPLTASEWNLYAVIIDVYIPTSLESNYYLSTTNGEITLNDLTCNIVDLGTTNGAITLDSVTATSIEAQTTNGVVQGSITTESSDMGTTNGAIDISLSQTSGVHEFSTTNGVIEINAPTGLEVGYKVNFDTNIGALDINLPDMDYEVDTVRTKIGETNGYSSKPVQIEISAETSIGGIEVN
jgi:DUF4097 and DUF4098 domain-containing protein YvlB